MKKISSLDTPQLISIKEASQMLNIHPNTLRRWDNQGLLKAVRLGARKDRSYQLEEILKFTSPKNAFKGDLENLTSRSSQFKSTYNNGHEAVKRLDQIL